MIKSITTDAQAFSAIKGRLGYEVGKLLELASKNNLDPFWASLRMLFPIAEAMGDLIYRDEKTNLYKILNREYSKLNRSYSNAAALVILLYRHSLMHCDMLRTLKFEGSQVEWGLQYDWGSDHLKISNNNNRISLAFNIMQFYKDTIKVCENLYTIDFNGNAGKRYDSWKEKALKRSNPSFIAKKAVKEIESLTSNIKHQASNF